jgi:predicted amidohydrolase YtcJ
MAMKLLDNGRIYSFDAASGGFVRRRSILIDGTQIVALDDDAVGIGAERIDLQGATVLPAFADCHVHLTDTGYFLGARDLGTVRTYDEYCDAVDRVPNDGGIVFAGQYDESAWSDGGTADARPLERVHGGARAMLVRIDSHSCIVNRRTFEELSIPPHTKGIERDERGEPTGKLFLDANWTAQSAFMAQLPLAVRRSAERRAIELALANGALHLHAQLLGFARDGYAAEIHCLQAHAAKIHPKICEPDATIARDLGLPYIGGDVFLDGSIGSRTACFTQPYTDDGATAALRFSDDEVLGYFAQAEALGIGAGVHAIGDAAIEQCVRVWERVLGGKPSARGSRHFIEHFECATPDQIDACVRMEIYLSMQPQFDELWGGRGRMYDVRLGTERMRSMNALARIEAAGGVLCGGDDSPVCALSPLTGMQACVDHHEPGERLAPQRALAMYTLNAARFGHAECHTGNVASGLAADLVFLDRDPLDGARFAACSVMQTWRDGEIVFTR